MVGATRRKSRRQKGSVKKTEDVARPKSGAEEKPRAHMGSDAGDRAVEWVTQHSRRITIGAVAVVLLGGGVWFTREARVRKENFASRELSQARTAAGAGNFQLAASDLSRIVRTYGRTPAGQEAMVLLANVRMQQGQTALAVAELQEFLSGSPQRPFVAPAAGLLGMALEELGDFSRAADAYQQAADAVGYSMIRSQYLIELGRVAWTAGDTARAAAAYERVIEENEDDLAAVTEAKFRLAEMRPQAAR